MQRTFNRLDGLYLRERCHLIDTIMKHQFRMHSAAEFEELSRKKTRNKIKEGTYKPSKKGLFYEQNNPHKSSNK